METPVGARGSDVDLAMARAALLVDAGDSTAAAALVTEAFATTAGGAGWILPIEPLVGAQHTPEAWRVALAAVKGRAM
jgi:hypothetical protein